eukprot:CAMPEP_0173203836 /NCGR_PEP_ID=MMETSP1141-20130122/19748_1 /TAXON_ID=483371 /ORGANISM="non described non described, Strain CCMP2298" /LENGTH=67 /DNA_ID=CAMNT_0014129353 /DNA_START=38 /DNA_END=241 /DNA_ORIENTATION=+
MVLRARARDSEYAHCSVLAAAADADATVPAPASDDASVVPVSVPFTVAVTPAVSLLLPIAPTLSKGA